MREASWTISQAAALTEFCRRADEILLHKPKLSFEEWAPRFIENPDGTPFRFRPWQVQPARDLFDLSLPSVTIRAYSGAGKTYLISAAMCYAVEQLREQIGIMFPNKDAAQEWIGEELSKMFESTPAIADLRMLTDKVLLKVWNNGGKLSGLGANSSTQIRRLQASILYADEIDAIEQDKSDEGDKIDQFHMRARGRKRQNKWLTSYPSLKGASKVDAWYDKSDRCNLFVRCAKCEHQYVMHTNHMVWTPKKPETAHLICPECKRKLKEGERIEMAKAGEWLNRNREKPQRGVDRGFHLGCMNHTGNHNGAYDGYLHEVAAKIEARKTSDNPEKSRRVFVNTMDAESFAEEMEQKPQPDTLYAKREDWDPAQMMPPGVLMLTMAVDVQKNRLECMTVGWGVNSECWLIDYKVIQGSCQSVGTWNKLDKYRLKRWPHPHAGNLAPACVVVDSGKWQSTILEYTGPRTRARVYAIKGAKSIDRELVSKKPTMIGRPPAPQYHIGTHEAKDLIYQRLELDPPKKGNTYPRGFIHVPEVEAFSETTGGEATGFFEMLLAEDSVMKRSTRTGEFVRFFDCPRGQRNEALDLMVYNLAAERIMNPNYGVIASKMAK